MCIAKRVRGNEISRVTVTGEDIEQEGEKRNRSELTTVCSTLSASQPRTGAARTIRRQSQERELLREKKREREREIIFAFFSSLAAVLLLAE